MRRLLGAFLTVVLVVPALSVLAGGSANYKDTFDGGDYSGDSGSLDFDGAWAEYGDGGSGHSSGKVHVSSSGCSGECAHIDGSGVVLSGYGLERAADLGMFTSAELSFDVEVDPDPILLGLAATTASLQVDVHDGGWVRVATFHLGQARSDSVTIDVGDHANEDFKVRFGVPDGSLIYNGTASIDDVELTGTVIATTTTSTTTPPTPTTLIPTPSTPTIPQITLPTLPGVTTPTTTQPTSPTIPGSAPTTTTVEDSADDDERAATRSTTTTTAADTTTTTGDDAGVVAGGIPPRSGLHDPGVGLIADYEPGLMGQMGTERLEVLSAELTAEFSIAAETFRTARIWIAALALLMAVAVVSGMDRRRALRQAVGQVA